MGLLFLGGGRLSLASDKYSIAMLLISLYPRWPSSPSDNYYHLQALRHFFGAAAEVRELQALDMSTVST